MATAFKESRVGPNDLDVCRGAQTSQNPLKMRTGAAGGKGIGEFQQNPSSGNQRGFQGCILSHCPPVVLVARIDEREEEAGVGEDCLHPRFGVP